VKPSFYVFSLEHPLRRFCIWLTVDYFFFDVFMLLVVIGNCIALAFRDPPEELEYEP
jgi:hypothetical protein